MIRLFAAGIFLLFLCRGLSGFCQADSEGVAVAFDRSPLTTLRDGTPLARSAEKEAWQAVTTYLQETPEPALRAQSVGEVGFFMLERQADAYRGRVVSVRGQLMYCKKLAGSDFFLCLLRMDDGAEGGEIPLTLCVQELPPGFPVGSQLKEPVSATGIFYKCRAYLTETPQKDDHSVEKDHVPRVFASPTLLARTISWKPDHVHPTKKEPDRYPPAGTEVAALPWSETNSSKALSGNLICTNNTFNDLSSLLAEFGDDATLLERIPSISGSELRAATRQRAAAERLRKKLALTFDDSPIFYALLRAVNRMPAGSLTAVIERQTEKTGASEGDSYSKTGSLEKELFLHPEQMRGRVIRLRGRAKRILPTLIVHPEIREKYGLNQYYQIYLFNEATQRSPIVFCVPKLPRGMPVGAAESLNEEMSISGFLYKPWAYETRSGEMRFSPLMIGGDPVWYPDSRPAKRIAPFFSSAFFFVMLLLTWCYIRFRTRRKAYKPLPNPIQVTPPEVSNRFEMSPII